MMKKLMGRDWGKLIRIVFICIIVIILFCQVVYADPLNFSGLSIQIESQGEEQGTAFVL